MNDETLLEAFNVWEELSHDPSKREAYRARLKYIIDEEAKMSDVLHRGRKEGKLERDKEVILSGVQNNVPLETLALITGHSIEEIKKIIQKHK